MAGQANPERAFAAGRALAPRPAEPATEPLTESAKDRTIRQLLELLNELRVALPGAQFLFAFLLTVSFATRFASVDHGLRLIFYACLLCTAVATILLMAPTVFHRVRWQRGNKAEVVRVGHRMFLAGMAFLALAMMTAVCFVSAFMLSSLAAGVATGICLFLLGLTWLALPLLHRFRPGSGE